MPKVALILPVPLLKHYGFLSNYHMVLPHAYQQYREYRDFYNRRAEAGDTILLDNGAPEGDLKTIEELALIISELRPTHIFLADVIHKGRETLDKSLEMMIALKEALEEECPKLIGVPQGGTIAEWDECFNAFNKHPDIDVLGISKYFPKEFHTREQCLLHVARRIKKPVHLLGLSNADGVLEPLIYSNNVMGVDSAHFYLIARYYYHNSRLNIMRDGGPYPIPPVTRWIPDRVRPRGKRLQEFDEMDILQEEEPTHICKSLRQLIETIEGCTL